MLANFKKEEQRGRNWYVRPGAVKDHKLATLAVDRSRGTVDLKEIHCFVGERTKIFHPEALHSWASACARTKISMGGSAYRQTPLTTALESLELRPRFRKVLVASA